MSGRGIHTDQIPVDHALVRRLVAEQFPQWAGLPVVAVATAGTENAIFRLGGEMAVRLPYRPGNDQQLEKLQRWLPELGPGLPLPVPEVLARGAACRNFPAAWSVVRWLGGEEAALERFRDPVQAAETLAAFVRALMAMNADGAPAPGAHNFRRGVPLSGRDGMTRRAIAESDGLVGTKALTRAWEQAFAAAPGAGPPTWLHGDLAPDNLLVENGKLSAVIDWGGLGAGDPATELLPAWNLFRGESRAAYRAALGLDDAAWARGRGWVLSTAVVALPYYRHTLPVRAERAMTVIREVLAAPEEG